MAFPHNPNLSFKPSLKDHFVAFDSGILGVTNNVDSYTIEFDEPYKNVVAIGVESAILTRSHTSCDYTTLKLNNISNLDSSGVCKDDTRYITKIDAMDTAFAVFQFDPKLVINSKQFFKHCDIYPNHRELRNPIGKLSCLNLNWKISDYTTNQATNQVTEVDAGFENTIAIKSNHNLIFKITTCS